MIALHLYYEDLDGLLIKAVFPLLAILQQKNLVDSYFFVRYLEGGQHLRLRVATNNRAHFLAKAESFFTLFFKKNPTQRLTENPSFQANNTMLLQPYEREISRYGGLDNMNWAEAHFALSSETVRHLMVFSPVWNTETAIGWSLQLQLLFIHAVGFNKAKGFLFFEKYALNWANTIFQKTDSVTNFEKAFEQGKYTEAITAGRALWEGLSEEPDFEVDFLKDWYWKSQSITQKMTFDNWKIYADFIHMTNNRLGIANQDEVLLGFLLAHVFGRKEVQ